MRVINKIQLIGSLDEDKIKPHLELFNDRFLNARNIGLNPSVIKSISLVDLEDKIFENSYSAAVGDTVFWHAILKNYTYKNDIKQECKKTIMSCIKDLLSYKTFVTTTYRNWHTETMNKLKTAVNDVLIKKTPSYKGANWTIGNSQKILNLFMKYIWVVTLKVKKICTNYKQNEFYKKYWKVIHSIENDLDIPVDRYILFAIYSWNMQKVLDFKSEKIILPISTTGDIKEWSKWDFNDYNSFSESLHKYFKTPIVWEGYAWDIGKMHYKSNKNLFHITPFADLTMEELHKISSYSSSNGFVGHEDLLKFLK